MAVIGQCPVTATSLAESAAGLGSVGDLDRLHTALPGSFHLAASVRGRTRIQGSVSGLRRVFHTQIGRVTVAGDRSDVLAGLAGAGVDEERLSGHLLYPWTPHPLTDRTPWKGVRGLPADHCLLVEEDGTARTRRWWLPPEPDLGLAEGARALADRLREAVAARTPTSADLSGGLDSTALCFLAAGCLPATGLTTVTLGTTDGANDDVTWATLAAERLTGVGHELVEPGSVPLPYENMWTFEPVDEPFPGVKDIARFDAVWRRLAGLGSRVHLGGFGGDEVLECPPAYLNTIARRHPLTALSHLRGYRARYRWPAGGALRALVDRRGYRTWLSHSADEIGGSPAGKPHHWEPAFALPPWATEEAARVARRLVRGAAQDADPLAPDRGRHEALSIIRHGGHTYRQAVRSARRAGLDLALPFLDDRVLVACLAVRMEERTTPWRYKPLLTEAMRGTVPDRLLARTTKGHYAVDGHTGLRRSRARLAELFEDSALAGLGLIDTGALRRALSLFPPALGLPALDATLSCELWLRQARQGTVVKGRT